MRSPLNVIMSGLKLLQAEIMKPTSAEERANLMDTVASMHQEGDDLLKILNDLLQLDKLESSAFTIEERMIPYYSFCKYYCHLLHAVFVGAAAGGGVEGAAGRAGSSISGRH